jgi:hypothetical protein
MNVLPYDNTIAFDVDETLIKWVSAPTENSITLNYYGESVYVELHKPHIRFLRSMLKRGRNVILWSGNGGIWAREVALYLLIQGLIPDDLSDLTIMTKPTEYVDDSPVDKWMTKRIYLDDNE